MFGAAGWKRPEEAGVRGMVQRRAEDLVAKPVFYFMDLMPTQAQPESVPEAFCSRDIPEKNQRRPERCALIERP